VERQRPAAHVEGGGPGPPDRRLVRVPVHVSAHRR
jgi:hypothetical protein